MRAIGLLAILLSLSGAAIAQEDFADLAARASTARSANDPSSAIRLYRQALDRNPNWKEGWWMTGSLLYDAGSYSEAVDALRAFVKLSPGAAPGWALLGLCEYETRQFDPALKDIQKGLSLGIGNQPQMELVLRFHEAALLTKTGKFDLALERYTSFVSGEVRDEQLLIGLGLVNLRRRLAPVETATPDERAMLMLAGKAENAQLIGNRPSAEAAYAELRQRFPRDLGIRYAYGYFLLGVDPASAIAQWEDVLLSDPGHAPTHAMLSWALWLQGDKAPALLHARAAVAKDPGLVIAQVVLGRLLVESGDLTNGLGHLDAAVQAQPSNLEAHLALATAYSEAGRKADAQRERQWCLRTRAEAGAIASR